MVALEAPIMTKPDNPNRKSTTARHLQNLVLIRTLVLIGLALSIALSYWRSVPLVYSPLLLVLVSLGTLNLLTHWRLRGDLPVTDMELFTQLLIDWIGLSFLFYFSGGANNPFVFYFLVPICISATTLSWTYTWTITALCIASYSALLFFHIPLPLLSPAAGHIEHTDFINLHILGMWANFFISAVLITYFVVKMAHDLRHQQQLLNRRAEEELRNEQVIAVATLAAGTAHELATPLSTIKVIVNDLRTDYSHVPELYDDLKILTDQVELCTQTLKQLVNTAEKTRSEHLTQQAVSNFCHQIIERWQLIRPDARAEVVIDPDSPNISFAFPPTVSQSIINLLNNAADASDSPISVSIHWSPGELFWKIEDNGAGVPQDLRDQLGKAFITTKGSGLGLGLLLTHATLNRYGGEVRFYKRKPRGTVTELKFPLKFA
jgi:two-component system sensor histidine kinase RegB